MTGILNWFEQLPPPTIERLGKINEAATSSAHIVLALSYGLYDGHIRAVNRLIVGLLLARHKAQRCGDLLREQRIEAKLQDFHEAINIVTGTGGGVVGEGGSACKRPVNMRLAG